ncbi:hypothetical protein [Colwellia sp. C1TZA3]|nr:hypothetical protein [Colwellia sp. C1TZA3]
MPNTLALVLLRADMISAKAFTSGNFLSTVILSPLTLFSLLLLIKV